MYLINLCNTLNKNIFQVCKKMTYYTKTRIQGSLLHIDQPNVEVQRMFLCFILCCCVTYREKIKLY